MNTATVVPTTINFNSHPVRCFPDPEPCVPMVDIARAIDYNRQSINDMVSRDSVLKSYMVSVTLPLQIANGGFRNAKHNCLTKDGMVGLMVKLNTSRVKDPDKKARIQEFQRWAITTLRAAMENKSSLPAPAKQIALTTLTTLTPEQQHKAKKQVEKLARESELMPRIAFSRIWNDVKNHFTVATYKDIPSSRFEELMRLLGAPLDETNSSVLVGSVLVGAQALKGTLAMVKLVKERRDELFDAQTEVNKAFATHKYSVKKLNEAIYRIHDVLTDLPCHARGLCLNKQY